MEAQLRTLWPHPCDECEQLDIPKFKCSNEHTFFHGEVAFAQFAGMKASAATALLKVMLFPRRARPGRNVEDRERRQAIENVQNMYDVMRAHGLFLPEHAATNSQDAGDKVTKRDSVCPRTRRKDPASRGPLLWTRRSLTWIACSWVYAYPWRRFGTSLRCSIPKQWMWNVRRRAKAAPL